MHTNFRTLVRYTLACAIALTWSPVVTQPALAGESKILDTDTATNEVVQLNQKHIKRLYERSCSACHASGAALAPRSHDEAAWGLRLEKSMSELIKNTKNGFKGMPPGGLCYGCSDQEFEALILYMAGPR
jgi:cytochrome c5